MTEKDFEVTIGDVVLEHPIMNAAGTCKYLADSPDGIRQMAESSLSALIIGTITKESREGNKGKDFYWQDDFALNARGLPNPGLRYYRENWVTIKGFCENAKNGPKPIFISIFGDDVFEFAYLAKFFLDRNAGLVELNLSCPNVAGQGKLARVICYDPQVVRNILTSIFLMVGDRLNVAVKLAPFVDNLLLDEVVKVIVGFPMVRAITTCNSFPGTYDLDETGKPRIQTADGNVLGGMSGPALMLIALGQVVQIKDVLDKIGSDIKIIGVGGIRSGLDVWKFQQAGADVVQVGSAFLKNPNIRIFDQILSDFIEVSEGFELINDLCQS